MLAAIPRASFTNNPNWCLLDDRDLRVSDVAFRQVAIANLYLSDYAGQNLLLNKTERKFQ